MPKSLATLARPYAKAAFQAADDGRNLDSWSSSLCNLAEVAANSAVKELIANPCVGDEEVISFLLNFVEGDASHQQQVKNLLQLLADNNKLFLLPEVSNIYEMFKLEAQKEIEVEICSAFELTGEQLKSFESVLTEKCNRKVRINSQVDAALLGGALVRSGDKVLDGTLIGRWSQMAEKLGF